MAWLIIFAVIPVSTFLPEALAALLRKAPTTPEKIAFAWRQAVGPAVDRATTIELVGTTLQVRVRNAQWQREIERSAALVRSRLDALLGTGVIRFIDVSIAP